MKIDYVKREIPNTNGNWQYWTPKKERLSDYEAFCLRMSWKIVIGDNNYVMIDGVLEHCYDNSRMFVTESNNLVLELRDHECNTFAVYNIDLSFE